MDTGGGDLWKKSEGDRDGDSVGRNQNKNKARGANEKEEKDLAVEGRRGEEERIPS